MQELSTLRLNLLRSLYLLVVVGLALVVWPTILFPSKPWGHGQGIILCMLGAFSLLSALGLRYPLQLLPILLWELTWKTIWLLMAALPAWRAGTMDEATMGTAIECLVVVVFVPIIPWGYVYQNYLRKPAERWKLAAAGKPVNG